MKTDTQVVVTNYIPESGYVTLTVVIDPDMARHLSHIIPKTADNVQDKLAIVVKDILDARLSSDCYNHPIWSMT